MSSSYRSDDGSGFDLTLNIVTWYVISRKLWNISVYDCSVLWRLHSRAKPVWSTAKDVLEKLRPLHPLPGVILEWRRLTAALTKVVFPLQRGRTFCKTLAMDRMHSIVDTFTATGRVTMHEPNLQNVPKDFAIEIPCKKSRCSQCTRRLCCWNSF